MSKAARIRERHRAEAAGETRPNRNSLDASNPKGNRRLRRTRQVTQRYQFHRVGTPKVRRPSTEPRMGRASQRARERNGVSRGAPTNMTRRDDPRTWAEGSVKGSRRASVRARWTPGAVFRTLSGKRWVDLDKVPEEPSGV